MSRATQVMTEAAGIQTQLSPSPNQCSELPHYNISPNKQPFCRLANCLIHSKWVFCPTPPRPMRDPLIGTCPMGLQEDSQLPDLALTSFVPTHCILKASAPAAQRFQREGGGAGAQGGVGQGGEGSCHPGWGLIKQEMTNWILPFSPSLTVQ